MAELSGKVASITGGSSCTGLGGVFALTMASALVIISGRDPARLDSTLEELRAVDNAEIAPLDTTDSNAVPRMAAKIIQQHGHIDISVNGAGGNIAKWNFHDMFVAGWDDMVGSIFRGYSIASSKCCLTCASARAGSSMLQMLSGCYQPRIGAVKND